jgi:hypothetical protein
MLLSLRIDRLRRTFHAPSFILDKLPLRPKVRGSFYQAIGRFERQEDIQMMTKTVFILAGALAALPAMGETITFTMSATGSGTFNGTSFSDETITFTQVVADTSDISDTTIACSFGYPCAPDVIDNAVTIDGVGYLLTGTSYFFDNSINVVGITNESGVAYLAAEDSTPFGTYNLASALASASYPLYTPSSLSGVSTSGGDLSATFSGDVTFSAVLGSSTSAAPEPGSLGLVLVAGIPLAVGLLRRRQASLPSHKAGEFSVSQTS